MLALVGVESAQHDVGDLVGAMGPNIDDLVVTFAGGDDAFAILFFDLGNLLLGAVDFLVLFLGDDHVIDADGTARTGGGAEAQLLQFVEHDDGLFVPADLVASPDEIAQLGFADDLVEEAQFSGQISLKMTRPTVVSMQDVLGVAVEGLCAPGPGLARRTRLSWRSNPPSL